MKISAGYLTINDDESVIAERLREAAWVRGLVIDIETLQIDDVGDQRVATVEAYPEED